MFNCGTDKVQYKLTSSLTLSVCSLMKGINLIIFKTVHTPDRANEIEAKVVRGDSLRTGAERKKTAIFLRKKDTVTLSKKHKTKL